MKDKLIFEEILQKAKVRLLNLHRDSGTGHVGGNFSCIDALLTLYHLNLGEKDQFVLSKGHSAGALYVTLWSMGLISEDDLKQYCKDGTGFPAHPSGNRIPGVIFGTGSLGHGPSLSAGIALASTLKNQRIKVFCLCSDGEWQEGSCWEALIFSVHNQISNLTIMIDQNNLQGFGATKDIVSYSDLESRIKAFGANVLTVDGHNFIEIDNAIKLENNKVPKVIILRTIKGIGFDYQGKVESHYLPLTEDSYEKALENFKNGKFS